MGIRRASQNCMALNLKSKLALVLFTISLSHTVGHSDKCCLPLNPGMKKTIQICDEFLYSGKISSNNFR